MPLKLTTPTAFFLNFQRLEIRDQMLESITWSLASSISSLVSIIFRLKWSFHFHADIVRLIL